ncbi:MAG TPA: nuclear transport factor 2 family protein [Gammaproteobacteria bacterium]|jgi:ketosteroid isomerase-like protein
MRISHRVLSWALPLALSWLLPGPAAADSTATVVTSGPPREVAALEKRIAQWLDGYNRADVKQMMDVFSADFTDESNDVVPTANKAQVTQAFTSLFAKYDARIVSITDEIRVSGDMAFDRGHYIQTFTSKTGGTTITQTGRFLEVWKREDGVWRVQHVMDIHDQAR